MRLRESFLDFSNEVGHRFPAETEGWEGGFGVWRG